MHQINLLGWLLSYYLQQKYNYPLQQQQQQIFIVPKAEYHSYLQVVKLIN